MFFNYDLLLQKPHGRIKSSNSSVLIPSTYSGVNSSDIVSVTFSTDDHDVFCTRIACTITMYGSSDHLLYLPVSCHGFCFYRQDIVSIFGFPLKYYLPLCFAFFFSCRRAYCRSFSASSCSRFCIFLSIFPCSCWSFNACCALVPMPLSCN